MNNRVPPPLVGMVCVFAIWLLARYVPQAHFDFPGRDIVAGALIGFGLILDVASMWRFFRLKTSVSPLRLDRANVLVIDGFYRFTRNPMYLGMAMIIAGFGFYWGTWLAVVPLAAFVLWINAFQIAPEEKALEATFGAAYRAYRQRVRRWI